jgi:hypothetical protein
VLCAIGKTFPRTGLGNCICAAITCSFASSTWEIRLLTHGASSNPDFFVLRMLARLPRIAGKRQPLSSNVSSTSTIGNQSSNSRLCGLTQLRVQFTVPQIVY